MKPNFPLSLAIFDAVPVLLFSAAMLLAGKELQNLCFFLGALLCTLAGIGKVTWKIILAGTQKDISPLSKQMLFLMPAGFLLILISFIYTLTKATARQAILQSILSFPSIVFFALTLVGMAAMGVLATKLDPTKTRSNWIEEITNTIAQGSFLLGILFCN